MTSLLEKRLYRIVEGQVRSFRNDHPEKFSAAALSKREWRTVEYSLAKRIVPDVMALLQSVGASTTVSADGGAVVKGTSGCVTGGSAGEVAEQTASPVST